MIELHLGDCLEIMPTLEDGSVDAVITDPPFFMPATHYQSRVKWQRKWADVSVVQVWWDVICQEFRRIVKDSGHTLAFCNCDSYAAFYPPMYGLWDKLVSIVWDKDRPGLGRVWRHQHELIIGARNRGAFEARNGNLFPDVIRHKATRSKDRLHPVEKPSEMLAELIEACCPPDGIILDAYMGSGTTGVACVQTGRNFIGIEIEPKYFEIAEKRIKEAQLQIRMPL